jgi:2-oxoglutarate dehydrogenase E1 component
VALDETRQSAPVPSRAAKPPAPQGVLPHVASGVDRAVLDEVFDHLSAYPPGFTPHPKLVKQFDARSKLYHEGGEVEWATAEALAIGSLVLEGTDVRLAGEDSRRGTFSQRHATLIDYDTEVAWTPLNDLPNATAKFRVYDSLLSEYAAVGFEYGYSVANKEALVLWEAQFGDFVNGAQIIIDQYLVAAEDKWGQTSGLVLLLPHGYEGQGPEHSSARIERFLTQCAEDNIQVCNATTAAQYFHLLRRQIRRDVRKPLVQFTPKRPLRMKQTRSPIEDLVQGSFQEVLDDPGVTDPAAVRRLIFCSGKVAYDAMAERDERQAPVAVIRVEQLFPFPQEQMLALLARYSGTKDLLWLQEEPENMGAWGYVEHRTYRVKYQGYDIRHVARVESGSPATGSGTIHEQELADLMEDAFRDL